MRQTEYRDDGSCKLIFSDFDFTYNDAMNLLNDMIAEGSAPESLKEDDPEQAAYELMNDVIEQNWEDIKYNEDLDFEFPKSIITFADLGYWDGRRKAHEVINPGVLKECFSTRGLDCDYARWYVDGYGDLRADFFHHDGEHHLLFRVLNDDLTELRENNFMRKLSEGKMDDHELATKTYRLGDKLGEIFGFKLKKLGRKSVCKK